MTDDTMNLKALVGKSADADFLREMIGVAAQRLMDLEVGNLNGAGYGEKSSDRLPNITVTASGTGRRGPARSNCASPS
jgi:hypothetical protein